MSKDSFKNLGCQIIHWTVSLGGFLDVVSSMTFSSGDVQAELHHAITRLMVFCMCILNFNLFCQTILYLGFWMLFVIFFCIYRLFDIYEPGMCHFIDHKANLNNALPSVECFFIPTYEVIRGDRHMSKKQLFVSVLCLSWVIKF